MSFITTKSFKLAVYAKGDPNAKKLALVIPGRLDSKDFAHIHSHVDFLSTKGFYALSFDPPGTWESGDDMTVYTATNYLKAIHEVVEFYGNRPTLLVGHSRGGKMTIVAGSINPAIFAYVSIFSGIATKDEMPTVDEKWQKDGIHITYRALPPGTGERVKEYRQPYSFFEDQRQYILTPEIQNCTKPKLFFAGKRDTIVPEEKVKKTYALLSKPKELIEVDSGHDYWLEPKIIGEINIDIEKFLESLAEPS